MHRPYKRTLSSAVFHTCSNLRSQAKRLHYSLCQFTMVGDWQLLTWIPQNWTTADRMLLRRKNCSALEEMSMDSTAHLGPSLMAVSLILFVSNSESKSTDWSSIFGASITVRRHMSCIEQLKHVPHLLLWKWSFLFLITWISLILGWQLYV